jgi:hypothetical protein
VKAEDDDALRQVWAAANRHHLLAVQVQTEGGRPTVAELIQARHEMFTRPPVADEEAPPEPEQEPVEGEVINPLLERSPVADPPEQRRLDAARRGVLSSLETLGVTEDDIAKRFGRPAEQVATKRLTALVRDVISTKRAQQDGDQQ